MSPYKTLSLPPKKQNFERIIKMFDADEGALAKLVTAVSISLAPSEVSGPLKCVQSVFGRWENHQEFAKTIYIDDRWRAFLATFLNISHIEIDTPFLLGKGLVYDFEASWALVRSVIDSCSISSATLDNHNAEDSGDEDGPADRPACHRQAWVDPIQVSGDLYITRISSLCLRITDPWNAHVLEDSDPLVATLLSQAHSLEHLKLYTDVDENFGPQALGVISKWAKIRTLNLRNFEIETDEVKGIFTRFLFAHRHTLRKVKCQVYLHSEELLWELVQFMHRDLTLESCDLEAQAWSGENFEGLMPQLRDVIRRFGGPELAIKDDEDIVENHGLALNRYILGQPARSE